MCLVLVCAMLAGCTSNPGASSDSTEESAASVSETTIVNEGDPIILATMTDEEGQIYGEIIKQVLVENGFEVDASGVGTYNNTTLPRQSLMEDQIDLVVDYTGRGMMFISDVDTSLYTTDLETAFQTTKDADAENGLVWMCYSPYNNTDGLCVRKDWAEENNIKDYNDLAEYLNNGGEFKLAIATEYSYVATAETCLPGWEETYGFELSDDQLVIGVSEPQNMVANETDGITASNCYTTGGALDTLGLYVIEDPEFVSPIYSPAAVAREEVVEKYPELQEILEPVFAAIDDDTIRDMNKRLEADGESAADIATQFLQDNDFIN
jgi:osmoprotectant transport system substrate-binding protein